VSVGHSSHDGALQREAWRLPGGSPNFGSPNIKTPRRSEPSIAVSVTA
jgi:hypothetical protein